MNKLIYSTEDYMNGGFSVLKTLVNGLYDNVNEEYKTVSKKDYERALEKLDLLATTGNFTSIEVETTELELNFKVKGVAEVDLDFVTGYRESEYEWGLKFLVNNDFPFVEYYEGLHQ